MTVKSKIISFIIRSMPLLTTAWGFIALGFVFIGIKIAVNSIPLGEYEGTGWSQVVHVFDEFCGHFITACFLLATWDVWHKNILADKEREKFFSELDVRDKKLVSAMELSIADTEFRQQSRIIGLVSVLAKLDDENVRQKNLISTSHCLTVLVGSGKDWIRRHEDALRKRLSDPSKITNFICVHPQSSIVEIGAKKLNKKSITYRDQLNRCVTTLKAMNTCEKGLAVYRHKVADHSFICIGDAGGFYIPKFAILDSRKSPVFELERGDNNSFLVKLEEDLKGLMIDENLCDLSKEF